MTSIKKRCPKTITYQCRSHCPADPSCEVTLDIRVKPPQQCIPLDGKGRAEWNIKDPEAIPFWVRHGKRARLEQQNLREPRGRAAEPLADPIPLRMCCVACGAPGAQLGPRSLHEAQYTCTNPLAHDGPYAFEVPVSHPSDDTWAANMTAHITVEKAFGPLEPQGDLT